MELKTFDSILSSLDILHHFIPMRTNYVKFNTQQIIIIIFYRSGLN